MWNPIFLSGKLQLPRGVRFRRLDEQPPPQRRGLDHNRWGKPATIQFKFHQSKFSHIVHSTSTVAWVARLTWVRLPKLRFIFELWESRLVENLRKTLKHYVTWVELLAIHSPPISLKQACSIFLTMSQRPLTFIINQQWPEQFIFLQCSAVSSKLKICSCIRSYRTCWVCSRNWNPDWCLPYEHTWA